MTGRTGRTGVRGSSARTVATTHRTTAEWERRVGEQLRELRRRHQLTQAELARRASVSTGTIRHLETGAGSSLATLIQVAKALDHTEWLDAIVPAVAVSPMDALRQRKGAVRTRWSTRPEP